MGMEDFGVLLVWGSCGDSHRFAVGMGLKRGLGSDEALKGGI